MPEGCTSGQVIILHLLLKLPGRFTGMTERIFLKKIETCN